jgi:hypothetical protein
MGGSQIVNWFITVLFFIAVPVVAKDFANVELDAKYWYETIYAPLWRDAETINLDAVRKHYIKGYRVHLTDGRYEPAANTVEEWRSTLKFFGETWVGSDLLKVTISAHNQNTVAIWSEWVNRNNDGTTSSGCANYVAGRTTKGGWQFYDLFIINCSDSDLAR